MFTLFKVTGDCAFKRTNISEAGKGYLRHTKTCMKYLHYMTMIVKDYEMFDVSSTKESLFLWGLRRNRNKPLKRRLANRWGIYNVTSGAQLFVLFCCLRDITEFIYKKKYRFVLNDPRVRTVMDRVTSRHYDVVVQMLECDGLCRAPETWCRLIISRENCMAPVSELGCKERIKEIAYRRLLCNWRTPLRLRISLGHLAAKSANIPNSFRTLLTTKISIARKLQTRSLEANSASMRRVYAAARCKFSRNSLSRGRRI